MDPRQILAQMIAMRGNHPMGGPPMFENDIPQPPFVPQLPPGWQPPGQAPLSGFDPTAGGPVQNTPPMPRFRAAPRVVVPPGKSTRRSELVT